MKEQVNEILGHSGKMLSGSKGQYNWDHPDNLVVFNSGVSDANGRYLWHGDIDITLEEDKLKRLAKVIGQTIYVFYEGNLYHKKEGCKEDIADAVYSTDLGYIKDKEYYGYKDGVIKAIPQPKVEVSEEEQAEIDKGIADSYKEEEYTKIHTFKKDYKSFFNKLDKDTGPLSHFWKPLMKKGVKEVMGIYISKYDYDELVRLTGLWIDAFHGECMSDYRKQNTLGMQMLQYGPCNFRVDPDWVEEGVVYKLEK